MLNHVRLKQNSSNRLSHGVSQFVFSPCVQADYYIGVIGIRADDLVNIGVGGRCLPSQNKTSCRALSGTTHSGRMCWKTYFTEMFLCTERIPSGSHAIPNAFSFNVGPTYFRSSLEQVAPLKTTLTCSSGLLLHLRNALQMNCPQSRLQKLPITLVGSFRTQVVMLIFTMRTRGLEIYHKVPQAFHKTPGVQRRGSSSSIRRAVHMHSRLS